jgi:uncharacterized protein
LVTSMPKSQIIHLISVQESIINQAKDIAGLVHGRRLVMPVSMHDSIMQYVNASSLACQQALSIIRALKSLDKSSFSDSLIKLTEEMIDHLHQLEGDADELEIHLRQELLLVEKKLDSIDVMFLYEIINRIGSLADRAEKLGDGVLLFLAQ